MGIDIKKYNFGIIGYGFLGSAIAHGFGLHADIKIYDKFKNYDPLEDVVNHAEIIWICLPTPMNLQTGKIDLSIIEENIREIHDLVPQPVNPWDYKIIVIKSTVVPGTTKYLAEKFPKLGFIMNPEFLTARNNRLDFICASRVILGGNNYTGSVDYFTKKMHDVYKYRFGESIPIYLCTWEEAEVTKYAANCFFATKISYFNFIHELCEAMHLKFDRIRDMTLADGRIGRSHANVPGWDNKRGYSGACFPKDINAFISFAKSIGVNPELLEASWSQNLRDRPEKDWEDIPSAVSNKDDK